MSAGLQTTKDLSNLRYILIGIVHIGVGIGIVSLTSFLNSELKFLGWSSSTISIYLGIPIIFELSRLFFGSLYDRSGYLQRSMLFGTIIGSLGLIFASNYILPVGNFGIIMLVSMYYFGSAILTTLVDSNLTELSDSKDRSKVAGVLQSLRLLGFAVGGFVGSILYSKLSFDIFMRLVGLIFAFFSIISLLSVISVDRYGEDSVGDKSSSIRELPTFIIQPLPKLMTIFLLLYPIGLFMQDLILEPFSIDILDFDKNNVGVVVAIWTSLTLIFVPIGVYLSNKTNKSYPIVGGQILSFLGLIGFSLTPDLQNISIFYISLIFFGIGNGIVSAPSIALMLEVCAIYKNNLSLLLGFFGILITLGRSLSSVIGGLILELSSNNYQLLFIIESIFVILAIIPITKLDRKMSADMEGKDVSSNMIFSPDLS